MSRIGKQSCDSVGGTELLSIVVLQLFYAVAISNGLVTGEVFYDGGLILADQRLLSSVDGATGRL